MVFVVCDIWGGLFRSYFLERNKINSSFKYTKNTKTNMVKIAVKEEWSTQSKLGVLGLVGSITVIIAVVLLD